MKWNGQSTRGRSRARVATPVNSDRSAKSAIIHFTPFTLFPRGRVCNRGAANQHGSWLHDDTRAGGRRRKAFANLLTLGPFAVQISEAETPGHDRNGIHAGFLRER